LVTLDDLKLAQQRLRGIATRTPLVACHLQTVSQKSDSRQLWLKPECFQPIGSFKLRGAYNKIASLPAEERKRGVITYSSGNHAQGVAYAARAMGVKAVIVMPNNAPLVKVESTRGYGAEIVTVGPGSRERQLKAEELAAEHGYVVIPPYNDEKIIAGAGTVGLEIIEDLLDVEVALVPVGGGGLISGTATAIKLLHPNARVIGVEPALASDAQASLRSGRIVEFTAEQVSRTLADGLRTQALGSITFEHMRKYVDDIITVTEDEIREAVRLMIAVAKIVPEPSGAVTFAAFLFHADELPKAQKHIAVVSGGNIEPALLAEIVGRGALSKA
jgi:threonine dehydratase